MTLDRKPLPRFWYLPRGEKAAVVMTGDDHANGGTSGQFDRFMAESAPGCSVADWQCVRATSYVYPGTPLTDAQSGRVPGGGIRDRAAPTTSLDPPTATTSSPAAIGADLGAQLEAFAARWPSLAAPRDQPDALHRLQRLVDRAERRAGARHPARRQLLLLAGDVGGRPPGPVHRVGFPDAIRGRRRRADRRLPGWRPSSPTSRT